MQVILTPVEQQTAVAIDEHIKNRHPRYADWYIGIASVPEQRLFIDHNVDKDNDYWIYRNAGDQTAARNVELFFIEQLGTDGGPGGGDHTTKFVYAYKKTPSTRE